MTYKIKYWNLY